VARSGTCATERQGQTEKERKGERVRETQRESERERFIDTGRLQSSTVGVI